MARYLIQYNQLFRQIHRVWVDKQIGRSLGSRLVTQFSELRRHVDCQAVQIDRWIDRQTGRQITQMGTSNLVHLSKKTGRLPGHSQPSSLGRQTDKRTGRLSSRVLCKQPDFNKDGLLRSPPPYRCHGYQLQINTSHDQLYFQSFTSDVTTSPPGVFPRKPFVTWSS